MTEEKNKEIGRILWFDHKKGWGFVNIVHSFHDNQGKDFFVHYSSINCENRFKKLYPGEYVSLFIEENKVENVDPKKKFVCRDVTGLYGGPLLIDNIKYTYKVFSNTRNDIRNNTEHYTEHDTEHDHTMN